MLSESNPKLESLVYSIEFVKLKLFKFTLTPAILFNYYFLYNSKAHYKSVTRKNSS